MTDYAKKNPREYTCTEHLLQTQVSCYLKYMCIMPKVIKPYYELIPFQVFLLTLQHFSSNTNTKKASIEKMPTAEPLSLKIYFKTSHHSQAKSLKLWMQCFRLQCGFFTIEL